MQATKSAGDFGGYREWLSHDSISIVSSYEEASLLSNQPAPFIQHVPARLTASKSFPLQSKGGELQ